VLDINGFPIGVPPAPTLTQSAGGSLGATTYYVKLTYNTPTPPPPPGPPPAGQLTWSPGQLNSSGTLPNSNQLNQPQPGESPGSVEASLAVSASNLLGVTSPAASPGVTSYNVYVGTAAGQETLQANNIPIGTNWTEPTSGLTNNGIAPPAGLSVAFAALPSQSNQAASGVNQGPYVLFASSPAAIAVDQNGNATSPNVTAGPIAGQVGVQASVNAPNPPLSAFFALTV
jgi:hypothetical protein